MAEVRDDFLAAAGCAAELLREQAVAAAWAQPSALPEFSVGGLAGHLAFQVIALPPAIAAPEPTEETVPLLGHYERVGWIGADVGAAVNVRIRELGDEAAAAGPAALADRVDAAVTELAGTFRTVPNRPVRLGLWGPWSLRLDDMLVTRMMELVVHGDDLAVSVGVPTPEFPPSAVEAVVDLLSRLALRRHGTPAVVRALSRAERAPSSIAAF